MKKILLVLVMIFGLTQVNAQIDFGVKAGINFNSETFNANQTLSKLSDYNTEDKMGYHAGIWTRFKLPIVGLYVRPELVYTALKSEVTLNAVTTDYDFRKLDIPVLAGYKIGGVFSLYAGPAFQYIIENSFTAETISEIKASDFTVGMQLGAGVELGNIGIDVRWERGFSDIESEFTQELIGGARDYEFDTRVNQIILGLSYKF